MSSQPKRAGWSTLPTTLADGQMVPHMSARYRTAMIDAVFEGAGGFPRMLAWVEASDDNYGDFIKMWAKGAVKSTNIELSGAGDVESLLAQLDAGDNAKVIGESD